MRRVKRMLYVILAVMLGCSGLTALASEADQSGYLDAGTNLDLKIVIGEGMATPSGEAGKEVTVSVPVKNNTDGSIVISDFKLEPVVSSDPQAFPFVLPSVHNSVSLPEDGGEFTTGTEALAVYTFKIREDVSGKNIPVKFKATYKSTMTTDEGSKTQFYSQDQLIYFSIDPKQDDTPDTPDTPDTNSGSQTPDTDPSDPGLSFGGGGDGGALSGGGSGGGESNQSVPRIMVGGYTTVPKDITAGSTFTLNLKIRNTSKKSTIQNLKIVLSSGEDNAFLPSNGSNTIYIEKIGKDSTVETTLDLTAKASLEQKPYEITLDAEYEDASAAQYKSTDKIAIQIKQEMRVNMSELTLSPSDLTVGQETNVMFNVYNMGKSKIYNVMATFESNKEMGDATAFVGNLDPGATGAVDQMLTAMSISSGEPYKAIVTFEDDAGEKYTIEKEFNVNISDMDYSQFDDMNNFDEFNEEEVKKPNIGLYVGIGLGVLVIVGIIVTVIIKKKRKKLMEEIDEDEIS